MKHSQRGLEGAQPLWTYLSMTCISLVIVRCNAVHVELAHRRLFHFNFNYFWQVACSISPVGGSIIQVQNELCEYNGLVTVVQHKTDKMSLFAIYIFHVSRIHLILANSCYICCLRWLWTECKRAKFNVLEFPLSINKNQNDQQHYIKPAWIW